MRFNLTALLESLKKLTNGVRLHQDAGQLLRVFYDDFLELEDCDCYFRIFLCEAVESDHLPLVTLLVTIDHCDLNSRLQFSSPIFKITIGTVKNPLFIAVHYRNLAIINILLRAGASIHVKVQPSTFPRVVNRGLGPLSAMEYASLLKQQDIITLFSSHDAVRISKLKRVRAILRDAKVLFTEEELLTPLHAVLRLVPSLNLWHTVILLPAVVRRILDEGASVHDCDSSGLSPLNFFIGQVKAMLLMSAIYITDISARKLIGWHSALLEKPQSIKYRCNRNRDCSKLERSCFVDTMQVLLNAGSKLISRYSYQPAASILREIRIVDYVGVRSGTRAFGNNWKLISELLEMMLMDGKLSSYSPYASIVSNAQKIGILREKTVVPSVLRRYNEMMDTLANISRTFLFVDPKNNRDWITRNDMLKEDHPLYVYSQDSLHSLFIIAGHSTLPGRSKKLVRVLLGDIRSEAVLHELSIMLRRLETRSAEKGKDDAQTLRNARQWFPDEMIPFSLRHLARRVIINNMSHRCIRGVATLELPQQLKDYILFKK